MLLDNYVTRPQSLKKHAGRKKNSTTVADKTNISHYITFHYKYTSIQVYK